MACRENNSTDGRPEVGPEVEEHALVRHSTESLKFVFMRISRRNDARAEKLTPKLQELKSVTILPTRQARTSRC